MTSVLSPSTTSVLGTSVPPSVPTGKESYALGVKLPLVGTKWAKLEEVMKNIPDNLEAKYYAYSSTTLLRYSSLFSLKRKFKRMQEEKNASLRTTTQILSSFRNLEPQKQQHM
jgi:hypothetical protein